MHSVTRPQHRYRRFQNFRRHLRTLLALRLRRFFLFLRRHPPRNLLLPLQIRLRFRLLVSVLPFLLALSFLLLPR